MSFLIEIESLCPVTICCAVRRERIRVELKV